MAEQFLPWDLYRWTPEQNAKTEAGKWCASCGMVVDLMHDHEGPQALNRIAAALERIAEAMERDGR